MKQVAPDSIRLVWYQDSITGEVSSVDFSGETLNFWVYLKFVPREVVEAYVLESGESRPHPKDGWAYARGVMR